jgi:small subunit ribosomal protein S16
MLKIRLQRVGRKHEPVFRLVLTDSKNSTKSGRFLEILGNYDSRRGEQAVFNAPRITHWMSQGAQASETVHNLLVTKKIIEGKKINVLPRKKPIAKEGQEPQGAEGTQGASANTDVNTHANTDTPAETPADVAPEEVAAA